jgi:hypothetical protein
MLNVSVRPQPAAVAAVSVLAALGRLHPTMHHIDELSTWYCFTDKFEEDRARRKQRAEEQRFADPQPEPATNPFKKVGRRSLPLRQRQEIQEVLLTLVEGVVGIPLSCGTRADRGASVPGPWWHL